MVNRMPQPQIAPTDVRYIKVGDGSRWFKRARGEGTILFGYHTVSHQDGLNRNVAGIRAALADRGSEGAVTRGVNEVLAFYELGGECLWITFAEGHLWWTFAHPEVTWLDEFIPDDGPSRRRQTVDGWRNTDIFGRPLRVNDLSSKLTQTGNYRSTICEVHERAYLIRRINGVTEPVVLEAEAARSQLISVADRMIRGLHWAQFETLTDLIFSRSGWQRSTAVGAGLKDIDLLMEQPTTGETAFVQVKSRAGQGTVDDYLQRFRDSGCDRLFFVCHSPQGVLTMPEEKNLHLFTGKALAMAAVKNGLFDWLIERSR